MNTQHAMFLRGMLYCALGTALLVTIIYPFVSKEPDQSGVFPAEVTVPDAPALDTENTTDDDGRFSGILSRIDTGCFSDGECVAIVGGKKVVALTGLRAYPEPVGQIIGAPSFGDLGQYIGSTVEVYAKKTGVDSYTLYGDENFYLKVSSTPLPQ